MEEKKITSEAETASDLKRLVRLSKPGTVQILLPVKRCVERIQEEFDLPSDDVSTVMLAEIIQEWYREQVKRISKTVLAEDRNLLIVGSKEEG